MCCLEETLEVKIRLDAEAADDLSSPEGLRRQTPLKIRLESCLESYLERRRGTRVNWNDRVWPEMTQKDLEGDSRNMK